MLQSGNGFGRLGFHGIGHRQQTRRLIVAGDHHDGLALFLQLCDITGGILQDGVVEPLGLAHPQGLAAHPAFHSESAMGSEIFQLAQQ